MWSWVSVGIITHTLLITVILKTGRFHINKSSDKLAGYSAIKGNL